MDSSPAIQMAPKAAGVARRAVAPVVYRRSELAVPHDVPRLARRMLALMDGRRSLDLLCRMVELDRSRGRAVALRLEQMGLARSGDSVPAEPEFNEQDRAFFASEVVDDEPWWEDAPRPTLGERIRGLVGRLRR